jgi:UDP-N-acetylmuramoyl-L-alanyl-D-glutamate--2,6-diaminopimelate ligase
MVDDVEYKAHTTPDSIAINYYLNEMIKEGVEFCFMEVSYMVFTKKRTALHFTGGVLLIYLMII